MVDEPKFEQSAKEDADFELTELEYEASQRQLSLDEQERLAKLRRHHQELDHDIIDRISPPEPETGNTVISGDDSP